MTCDTHWTTYLSALLTPTVAVLGSLIAYRQWRLAQNKLKLDLFDRRFSVYEAARNLLASIMTSGKAKDEEIFKFMVATREAKWVLNAQVAEYLEKQLYHKAIYLQTLVATVIGWLTKHWKLSSIWKWVIGVLKTRLITLTMTSRPS